MVQQQQAEQLLRALTGQAQSTPSDLEARTTQSRLTFAATIIAGRSNCSCEPCLLLRRALDTLLGDAMKEVSVESKPAPAELVEG